MATRLYGSLEEEGPIGMRETRGRLCSLVESKKRPESDPRCSGATQSIGHRPWLWGFLPVTDTS